MTPEAILANKPLILSQQVREAYFKKGYSVAPTRWKSQRLIPQLPITPSAVYRGTVKSDTVDVIC